MTTNGAAPASPATLKVLMLHGYTQSGPSFHAKTRALEKALHKALPTISLFYPTAPLRLRAPDIPGFSPATTDPVEVGNEEPDSWAWWRRKDDTYEYAGIEQGLARIAETLDAEGPFVGVVGFSQGGCAAGMVASLLEAGRREAFRKAEGKGGMPYPESFAELRHPPLRFAVSYSGFGAPHGLYRAFYEPKIGTPMVHFIGSLDTVVDEARSRRLVDACDAGGRDRVVYHPGGHFLPTQKQFLNVLIGFIQESIADRVEGEEEGKAENIDMAF